MTVILVSAQQCEIQDKVEDVMAKKILAGEVVRGDKVRVSVDPNSNLTISKAS